MNFLGVFLTTFLEFVSVEVLLVGNAVSIGGGGARFEKLILWFNLEREVLEE